VFHLHRTRLGLESYAPPLSSASFRRPGWVQQTMFE
jgi:hypothetical protein